MQRYLSCQNRFFHNPYPFISLKKLACPAGKKTQTLKLGLAQAVYALKKS